MDIERKEQIGNVTNYYVYDDLVMTVAKFDNNYYIIENSRVKLEGNYNSLDGFKTSVSSFKNGNKSHKTGRIYYSNKLIDHNRRWFCYILEEGGFVRKPKTIR